MKARDCRLCQCGIRYSLLVHMAVFGPFLFLFSILYTSTRETQKSLTNYITQSPIKKISSIFFSFKKKSQSVAAQLLVGRAGLERERFVHVCRRWDWFLRCVQSDSHLSRKQTTPLCRHLNPLFPFHFRSWPGSRRKYNPCSERKNKCAGKTIYETSPKV